MQLQQQKQQLLDQWREQSWDEKVIKAFEEVNREDFVMEEYKEYAYEDRPLPLLRDKTISQPTTVLIMTQALELKEGHKVFEIGTGSGYQAAIIAKLVGKKGKVVSTEVVPELVNFAKENFKKAGINNVKVIEDDGSRGYKKGAPYDRVIITAAAKEFPPKLIEQLKEGGIIVGPIGTMYEQKMIKGVKENGRLSLEALGSFLFTPMLGKYGFDV